MPKKNCNSQLENLLFGEQGGNVIFARGLLEVRRVKSDHACGRSRETVVINFRKRTGQGSRTKDTDDVF